MCFKAKCKHLKRHGWREIRTVQVFEIKFLRVVAKHAGGNLLLCTYFLLTSRSRSSKLHPVVIERSAVLKWFSVGKPKLEQDCE